MKACVQSILWYYVPSEVKEINSSKKCTVNTFTVPRKGFDHMCYPLHLGTYWALIINAGRKTCGCMWDNKKTFLEIRFQSIIILGWNDKVSALSPNNEIKLILEALFDPLASMQRNVRKYTCQGTSFERELQTTVNPSFITLLKSPILSFIPQRSSSSTGYLQMGGKKVLFIFTSFVCTFPVLLPVCHWCCKSRPLPLLPSATGKPDSLPAAGQLSVPLSLSPQLLRFS